MSHQKRNGCINEVNWSNKLKLLIDIVFILFAKLVTLVLSKMVDALHRKIAYKVQATKGRWNNCDRFIRTSIKDLHINNDDIVGFGRWIYWFQMQNNCNSMVFWKENIFLNNLLIKTLINMW